jgi:phenylalanyl-tRNA synthetase beta subunit
VALAMRFRDPSSTLEAAEVDAVMGRVRAALRSALGVQVRGT